MAEEDLDICDVSSLMALDAITGMDIPISFLDVPVEASLARPEVATTRVLSALDQPLVERATDKYSALANFTNKWVSEHVGDLVVVDGCPVSSNTHPNTRTLRSIILGAHDRRNAKTSQNGGAAILLCGPQWRKLRTRGWTSMARRSDSASSLGSLSSASLMKLLLGVASPRGFHRFICVGSSRLCKPILASQRMTDIELLRA